MHIPDGYLSPSTCACLFGASAPFWLVALRRVKQSLNTRMIPLLSVFAAFSFVIMMFNLPLPGGTTGHAVGMGVASVVLGPWAAIVAISVALLIQAVFFGDGGITAIGANCFNMAIVGSLFAFSVYRLLSRKAAIGSSRRVIAAAIAGYAGINVAALCAAIEFGIQPVLFHDASGAPLYAPYGLSVSIPAMLIGHLTFAGLAELVVSGGLVAWLQRVDPGLLRHTASDAPDLLNPDPPREDRLLWPTAWKLWLGLGVLLVLTPLGILAVGNAWGEWNARDFSDPQARHQIAAASGNQIPPAQAPRGLERLSSLWTAPLSGYAPAFIRSASFGYFVSAMLGVGLIVLLSLLLWWLTRGNRAAAAKESGRRRKSFVEKTIRSLLDVVQHALFAEETANSPGLLQRLDARVKLVGIGLLILAAVALQRISVLAGLLAAAVLLALASRISVRVLATRVWIAVLAFTGAIALPAIFLTPGVAVFRVPGLDWAVSSQGLRSAAFLILRAETAGTLAFLLILCTLWTQLLRALRFFRVPAILVIIVGMTYRYIFLLLQTAQDMFEAREARLIGILEPADRRRLAASSAGLLLEKSMQLSGDVHLAMQARGFRGEVHLLDNPIMRLRDWLGLATFARRGFRSNVAGPVTDVAETVFDVRGISYRYQNVTALTGLSMQVARGERVALLGANGSGKSTLLRLLAGLCFPEPGDILFLGESMSERRFEDAAFFYNFRRRVGLVFQNPDIQLFNPSVFDEVAFGPLQLRWPKARIREQVEAVLQTMGISHLRDRAPHRLSGGEKKRVALASVLITDPEVILLDEPSAALDPLSQAQIVDLLVSWKGSGKTVITATHDLDTLEDIADRCYVFEGGRIAGEGTPLAVLHDVALLERTSLVRMHQHVHDSGDVHPHPHLHRHDAH